MILEDITVIAPDLKFPEVPIALPDGGFSLVEIMGGTLTYVSPDEVVSTVADSGGRPIWFSHPGKTRARDLDYGKSVEILRLPPENQDFFTTNICFGGDDIQTAYITLSSLGLLVSCKWPKPGLRLNFLNT